MSTASDRSPSRKLGSYDGILIGVAHAKFRQMGAQGLRALGKETHVLYDLKYVLKPAEADLRL